MARKNTAAAIKPASQSAKGPRNPGEARKELLDRAARNAEGACHFRSDPLADAKASRVVVQTMEDLARDLAGLPGAGNHFDEHARLLEAQGALRAFFDLVAAKASLALAGDPGERARLLALVPRADDRRHRSA